VKSDTVYRLDLFGRVKTAVVVNIAMCCSTTDFWSLYMWMIWQFLPVVRVVWRKRMRRTTHCKNLVFLACFQSNILISRRLIKNMCCLVYCTVHWGIKIYVHFLFSSFEKFFWEEEPQVTQHNLRIIGFCSVVLKWSHQCVSVCVCVCSCWGLVCDVWKVCFFREIELFWLEAASFWPENRKFKDMGEKLWICV